MNTNINTVKENEMVYINGNPVGRAIRDINADSHYHGEGWREKVCKGKSLGTVRINSSMKGTTIPYYAERIVFSLVNFKSYHQVLINNVGKPVWWIVESDEIS